MEKRRKAAENLSAIAALRSVQAAQHACHSTAGGILTIGGSALMVLK